jgi:hypothetical protein
VLGALLSLHFAPPHRNTNLSDNAALIIGNSIGITERVTYLSPEHPPEAANCHTDFDAYRADKLGSGK